MEKHPMMQSISPLSTSSFFFSLEVSNVKEIKQGSCFDGMETCVYDVYVVYPGAMAKVLNADTFIDEETNLPHANWAFSTSDDERIDIMDDMEPLEITEDTIFGIQANVTGNPGTALKSWISWWIKSFVSSWDESGAHPRRN